MTATAGLAFDGSCSRSPTPGSSSAIRSTGLPHRSPNICKGRGRSRAATASFPLISCQEQHNIWSAPYDSTHGGFGKAPKFLHTMDLRALLRAWKRGGKVLSDKSLKMVRHTLDCMAMGGIYDHLGGGFARYSTDERWFAPHFSRAAGRARAWRRARAMRAMRDASGDALPMRDAA